MIRPAAIHLYLRVMEERGIATAVLLKNSDIIQEKLADPHYFIETSQLFTVVENMLRAAGDNGLGLDIGLARNVLDFGVLGQAALSCATPMQAIEEFWSCYGETLGMMSSLTAPKQDAETMVLDLWSADLSPALYRFFVEEALCLLYLVGGQVRGDKPELQHISFSYPEPPYVDRLKALFDCPFEFDAKHTRVSVGRSWLERPLPNADTELLHLYRSHLDKVRNEANSSSPLKIRLVELFLRSGGVILCQDSAAKELGMSTRSLRRQAQSEGVTYRQIVGQFQERMALEYLTYLDSSTKEVAFKLGYDDVNAFRRAFKKWTGYTVQQYRDSKAH